MSQLGMKMLEVARSQIGIRESGNNRGPHVKIYQDFIGHSLEGQPWCAAFTIWCIYQAAGRIGASAPIPRLGSSSGIYQWAKSHHRLAKTPKPGMIGLLRGHGGHEHTFMVEAVHGSEIGSIDGNWSDAVCRAHHNAHSCDFVEV